METVRWGLLSTANINRRLIPALRIAWRGQLAAVASRSQGAAEAYARKWEIPLAFGSYESMLESDAVDAVYVSLPNHLHAEWTVRALKAGKHVLCEKPFALTLEDVDKMIAAARETGQVLAEAFMYRHHPQTKIVGEWVRNGRLGEVMLVRSVFSFKIRDRSNIRLNPAYGGGSLWDIGIYPVSFAQYVMGEPPKWVMGDQLPGDTGVDEHFAGQLHYGEGRMAQVASAFNTPFHTVAEIIGTEGRLTLSRPFIAFDEDRQLLYHPAEGGPQEVMVPDEELYLGEIEDMHAAILDGRQTYLTLSETRNHVRTVLALYESAQQRGAVAL